MKKPSEVPEDTRSRLLRSAVRLFAEKGVEQVSLRELTASARVNLAAVSYHFGSKDALAEAVFDDIAARINARRVLELDAVLSAAEAARARPAIEDIVDTFIRPYLGPDPEGEGALLARLVLKHRIAPNVMSARIVRKHFDPVARRYVSAFAQACPDVDAGEFFWRYMFMTVTVVLTSTDRRRSNRVSTISGGKFDAADPVTLRAALLRFIKGGLEAPGR